MKVELVNISLFWLGNIVLKELVNIYLIKEKFYNEIGMVICFLFVFLSLYRRKLFIVR